MPLRSHQLNLDTAVFLPDAFITALTTIDVALRSHNASHRFTPLPRMSLPVCVTTTEFPLPCKKRGMARKRRLLVPRYARARGNRKRVVTSDHEEDTCCVCLESLHGSNQNVITLSCDHTFHDRCLWSVQTNNAYGAKGMVRCPLCRTPIDRYDLNAMGLDVSPSQLARIAIRCDALRRLQQNDPAPSSARTTWVKDAVRKCQPLTAVDGFLYNTCILALLFSSFAWESHSDTGME